MPPRTAPTEYQTHMKVGEVTIAAEFAGHGWATAQGPLSSEDYVVVETGLFGAAGTRVKLSVDDFSLRINGKKTPLRSQPYGLVLSSLEGSGVGAAGPSRVKKSSLDGGGDSGGRATTRRWCPRSRSRYSAPWSSVPKVALPEGDRALPVAGLIFFQYRGKAQGASGRSS